MRRLGAADAAELQDLHERCSDYFELVEGVPTRPDSAVEDLAELPPGRTIADKFYFGIYGAGGELVGALELARDLPAEGEWWLALLLLDPAERGRGLGRRILESAASWAREQNGGAISLAVLEQNRRAVRFWSENGFVEQRRTRFEAATGLESVAIVMRREVQGYE